MKKLFFVDRGVQLYLLTSGNLILKKFILLIDEHFSLNLEINRVNHQQARFEENIPKEDALPYLKNCVKLGHLNSKL